MVFFLKCCQPVKSIASEKERVSLRKKKLGLSDEEKRSSVGSESMPVNRRSLQRKGLDENRYKNLNAITEQGDLEFAASATGIELFAGGSASRQTKAMQLIREKCPEIFDEEAENMDKFESDYESEVRTSALRTSRQSKRAAGKTSLLSLTTASRNSSCSTIRAQRSNRSDSFEDMLKEDEKSSQTGNLSQHSSVDSFEEPRASKQRGLDLIFNDILKARASKEVKRNETSNVLRQNSSQNLHSAVASFTSLQAGLQSVYSS
ncbi:Oidioi.mRNA.OKI2018_I69.chr2.g4780.t1.cds [Oikopleura dioica]|uniref:Oidioi.mRNA.OKI2018_I69.chr2.g4780.t1.cds n=1 Tax=Oikopleura dioica TaxID=34765 RepID=A0ABN7T2P2_OIKDI|nr:Oidioi.mRNA.OKI2018_I69.chr2.g4780.t1.cds [Oikopleura dioica]